MREMLISTGKEDQKYELPLQTEVAQPVDLVFKPNSEEEKNMNKLEHDTFNKSSNLQRSSQYTDTKCSPKQIGPHAGKSVFKNKWWFHNF